MEFNFLQNSKSYMIRKLLLLASVLIGLVLINSYYLTPLLVGILAGTFVITSITTIVGFPNANIQNAFLLIMGWIVITGIVAIFPLGSAISFILVLVAYYLLIKALYKPPGIRAVFLLSLSMIFRKSIGFMLVPYLAEIAQLVIF